MGNSELAGGEQDALGVINKQGSGRIKLQPLMQGLMEDIKADIDKEAKSRKD